MEGINIKNKREHIRFRFLIVLLVFINISVRIIIAFGWFVFGIGEKGPTVRTDIPEFTIFASVYLILIDMPKFPEGQMVYYFKKTSCFDMSESRWQRWTIFYITLLIYGNLPVKAAIKLTRLHEEG
jgi:hypothetical protein